MPRTGLVGMLVTRGSTPRAPNAVVPVSRSGLATRKGHLYNLLSEKERGKTVRELQEYLSEQRASQQEGSPRNMFTTPALDTQVGCWARCAVVRAELTPTVLNSRRFLFRLIWF